ncbi:MAG: hypothetical protein HOJ07_09690 [Rhodospirillaceae bacterium]|nr:hypothetical protein [Rhodospirillaceae bacterium]MBT5675950.1 hypothetical protein [Rhodospirillaceae bacterium]
MSPRTARLIIASVIAICLLALLFIFQPFVKELYSAGCIMVAIGGLTFNVAPFANTQNSVRRVISVMAIVIAILLIAVGIAIGFVYLLLT